MSLNKKKKKSKESKGTKIFGMGGKKGSRERLQKKQNKSLRDVKKPLKAKGSGVGLVRDHMGTPLPPPPHAKPSKGKFKKSKDKKKKDKSKDKKGKRSKNKKNPSAATITKSGEPLQQTKSKSAELVPPVVVPGASGDMARMSQPNPIVHPSNVGNVSFGDTNASSLARHQPNYGSATVMVEPKAPEVIQKKSPSKDDDKTIREREKNAEVKENKQDDKERERYQIDKIRGYVEKTINGGIDEMQADFRNVKSNLPVAATRIDFDANMDQNRFADIVCVDQTRVYLENSETDYIHANWVTVGDKKDCIVTQLPMAETAPSFWDMILQKNVEGILLILTPFEYRAFCSYGVFPDKGDFLHFSNNIKVGEVRRVDVSKNWRLHVICVKQREKLRYVHLHHYMDWSHGKPPGDIAEMWQVESTFRKYAAPHVYASLSGSGRAGTYAALELAHSRLHHENYIRLNIQDCVAKVRDSRMHAVQSPSQMQFLHLAILTHVFAMPRANEILNKHEELYSKFLTLVGRYSRSLQKKECTGKSCERMNAN